MQKGFWRLCGRMPAILLAVAVGPAAMADGPDNPSGYPTDPAASGPAAIPVVDMHSFRPIRPTAGEMTSLNADAATMLPPPAPPAPGNEVPAPSAAMPAPLTMPTAPQPQPSADPTANSAIGVPAQACSPSCSYAPGGGLTFQFSPTMWCNVGVGIRTTFNSLSGNEVTDRNFFAVDNARLYFNGQVTQNIGFELNTDISGAGGDGFFDSSADRVGLPDSIHLLDAIVKFEFNDYANIWAGRMIPPSDRVTMDGLFFINGWDNPFVSNYPSVFEGRDDGVAYWGQAGAGRFKWEFGLYNGQGRFGAGNDWPVGVTGPNTNGDVEFAMRLQYDFLDPEPGYYSQSTYYGQKNIAAIGFAMMDQPNAMTDGVHTGTFVGWNLDFLAENKMTRWGSGTFEAAYYNYNVGGDVANDVAGKAWFVFGGWLLPQPIGCCCVCGRFRPWVRYQHYSYDDETVAGDNHAPTSEWDVGLDFIFCCTNNTRFSTFWGDRRDACGCEETIFRTGIQLIF
jgi:hypothetical protein